MSDLIDRQAAIDALSGTITLTGRVNAEATVEYIRIVADRLKRLPSAQPEKSTEKRTETHACDLISRHAAIDALEKSKKQYFDRRVIIGKMQDIVNNLPSAQSDIIRCKDCRWWDKSEDSPFGYCMAIKHGYMSEHWEIGIYRRYKGDFYCADAERRTDEQTD